MSIPEELLALYKPRRRWASVNFRYALAGALIAELLFQNRVVVRGDTLSVFDSKPTGDPILDDVLSRILRSDREKSLKWWIKSLYEGMKNIDQRLVDRVDLRSDVAGEELKARLRNAILQNQMEPRIATLVALCEACRISLLNREEARQARQRLRDVVRTNAVASAVSATVTEIEAMMALIAVSG